MLIISDDFPGLADAINTLFPKTEHQLSIVHIKRNLKRYLSKNNFILLLEKTNRRFYRF